MNTLRRIMRAKKVDVNQAEIVAEFRRLGWEVIDTHELGKGFPDIIAYNITQHPSLALSAFIEIKNGNAGYTDSEIKFMKNHPYLVTTVRSIEDVKELFG
jgi:hypothetical protein